jgi:hypothetical protein
MPCAAIMNFKLSFKKSKGGKNKEPKISKAPKGRHLKRKKYKGGTDKEPKSST